MARTKLGSHKKDFKTHEFIARDIFRIEIVLMKNHLYGVKVWIYGQMNNYV